MLHVVVAKRRNLFVGRVITARAGLVRLPADLGAGCGLSAVINVIVAEGIDLLIARIVAPSAGLVGFPSVGKTGSSLTLMVCVIVAEGVYFLIARVVTAGAGLVGLPAVGKAGRRLSLVVCVIVSERGGVSALGLVTARAFSHLCTTRNACRSIVLPFAPVMGECRDFNVCGVIAARTCIISFPSDIRASGFLCLVRDQVVAEGVYFLIARVIAACAGLIGFPSFGEAGSSLTVVVHVIVAERVDLLIARVIAARAGLIRLPAVVKAGRGLAVVIYVIVTEGVGFVRRVTVAAAGTGIGGVAVLRTGRFCNHADVIVAAFFNRSGLRCVAARAISGLYARLGAGGIRGLRPFSVIMPERINFFVTRVVAACASLVWFPAVFKAGRILSFMVHIIVAERVGFVRRVTVAAAGTGIGGVAVLRTGRFCNHADVIVAAFFNRSGLRCVAARAISGLYARLGTGGIRGLCPLSVIMPERVYFLVTCVITARAGLIGLPSVGKAGCRLSAMINIIVAEGRDFFCVCFTAYGTGIGFYSGVFTIRRNGNASFIPYVFAFHIMDIRV